jgi:hypothetical protein
VARKDPTPAARGEAVAPTDAAPTDAAPAAPATNAALVKSVPTNYGTGRSWKCANVRRVSPLYRSVLFQPIWAIFEVTFTAAERFQGETARPLLVGSSLLDPEVARLRELRSAVEACAKRKRGVLRATVTESHISWAVTNFDDPTKNDAIEGGTWVVFSNFSVGKK